jgi:hypothetical protein
MRWLIYMILVLPAVAHAEVMDKEFALSTVLLWTLLGALMIFWSARFKPLALVGTIPIVFGFFALHLPELLDPYVGPAIRSEAGPLYVIASWTGPMLILGALILGRAMRPRHAKPDI